MSRYVNYQDERFTVVSGVDHMLGNFIQLYDKEMQEETPEGEGLILDWSKRFGISSNYTGEPVVNDEELVKKAVENYLKENVPNLVIFTAQQRFSLN